VIGLNNSNINLSFNDIDGLPIPFDSRWTNIAIGLSGGADSALLTYLLCSMITNDTTVHVISHTRMWKTKPWQGWDSVGVFNWLSNKFPHITFKRHTNFIAPEIEYGNIGPALKDEYGKFVSGDNIESRAFAEYVCHWNSVDAFYNAVTRNPRDVDLGGMKERDIDQTANNQHLLISRHMGGWACHPFRFTDKSWIIRQYQRLGITELLSITRSCEGEFKDLDYINYTPGQYVPLCGECFWCKEREWAIEQSK
jgi:hypothetical protein